MTILVFPDQTVKWLSLMIALHYLCGLLFVIHSFGCWCSLLCTLCQGSEDETTQVVSSTLYHLEAIFLLLQKDEQTLKTCISDLEESIQAMTQDAANAARLYVTDEDIAKLPCTANDTVFAVKAPQGTTLEVPDPDEGLATGERRYRQATHTDLSLKILTSTHDILQSIVASNQIVLICSQYSV